MQRFEAAPWSTSLKVVSAIGTVVLFAASYAVYRAVPRGTRVPFAETFGELLVFVPPLILVTAILFVVTGYRLDSTRLYVQRLLWSTRIELDGIDRAWCDSSAMSGSIRVFGNGGLFSITGMYQNSTLGRYRAFVTDPKQAVVLRSPGRVVVVSPAHPGAFVSRLASVIPGMTVGEPSGTNATNAYH
jgi:hypothetical protein